MAYVILCPNCTGSFLHRPFLIVGSVDDRGQPWASILLGRPGFIGSPHDKQLDIVATPFAGDPLNRTLEVGARLGLLGIEFHTRRRNRVNGVVTELFDGGFSFQVGQSFGNCLKYIQARTLQWAFEQENESTRRPAEIVEKGYLDGVALWIVERADTFFIASTYPADNAVDARQGSDVSHRGGKPGFVRVQEGGTWLSVPDYSGNYFFNTLGNLLLNPRAGLLFLGFESGDLVYVTVKTSVVWEGAEVTRYDSQAQRLLRMQVQKVMYIKGCIKTQSIYSTEHSGQGGR